MSSRQYTLLGDLLKDFSVETTPGNRKAVATAASGLESGARVYIASLPKSSAADQVATAEQLRDAGLEPVPHIVARNIPHRSALEDLLRQFRDRAGVRRALVLAGDRDDAAGIYESSLQLISEGLLRDCGIEFLDIGCYPEGHPRIADTVLTQALEDKLAAADSAGFESSLISQFCFDADTIIEFLRKLRARGISTPVRVGVAGPTKRATLLKYAAICGVGPSLRALKGRSATMRALMNTETPETLLSQLATAQLTESSLCISGVHFFTFSALQDSVAWAARFASSDSADKELTCDGENDKHLSVGAQ